MVRVALTGGIATGKSHVLAAFAALQVPTIDADVLAHEVVGAGTPGAEAVRRRFGSEVITADGGIDRRRLGGIVFNDAAARRDLEAIVHPAVYGAIQRWFASLPSDTVYAIADIPLLFETGHEHDFDVVIVVACDRREQLRRIVARDRLTEDEARARIDAQWPLEEKISRADYVISTMGTAEERTARVADVARAIAARR